MGRPEALIVQSLAQTACLSPLRAAGTLGLSPSHAGIRSEPSDNLDSWVNVVLFHVEKPKESAYKIDGLEATSVSAKPEENKKEEEVDITQLLAMGDLVHGQKVFKKCSACHMIASDGKNMIGPNLWSVIGRQAGSVKDYKYSKAMIAYGKEWSFEEMNAYLIKPQAYIKGTKMAFAGLRKEKDRASVILFMNSKSNNPKPLP